MFEGLTTGSLFALAEVVSPDRFCLSTLHTASYERLPSFSIFFAFLTQESVPFLLAKKSMESVQDWDN